MLIGSVAETVLRKAKCPVLVVKSPAAGADAAAHRAPSQPGDVIDVRPLGESLTRTQSGTFLHAQGIELSRLVLLAGKATAEHRTHGPTTIHCLEGQVILTALGKTQELASGELIVLPAQTSHSFQAIENASLLIAMHHP